MRGGVNSRPDAFASGAELPWVRPLFESLLRAAALSTPSPEAAQWYLDVLEDLDVNCSPAGRFVLPSNIRQEEGAL
jgi:hypothetical protein